MFSVEYLIIFVASVLFFFVFRALFVYLNKTWFDQGFCGDSSVHVEIIRQLNKNRNSKIIENYVIPNTMSYPTGFHRFVVRWFKLGAIEKYAWLPNLVVFTIFSACFFTYVRYIQISYLEYKGWDFLIVAVLIFTVSISNMIFFGPAIAYIKLSERLYARVLCAMCYLCIVVWLSWSDWPSFIAAIILCAACIMTSAFGFQFLLFTMPFVSLVFLTISNVAIVVLGFMLSVALTKGYSYVCVKHTIKYWYIYRNHVKKNKKFVNCLSNYVSIIQLWDSLKRKGFKKALWKHHNQEPVRLFLFYPELIILIICASVANLGNYYLVLGVFPPILVYLATSTKYFNHLGESYRYIEYGLYFYFPFVIALLYLSVPSWIFILLATLYVVYGIFVAVAYYGVHMRRFPYPDKDALTEFLRNTDIDNNSVVFPVTMRIGADVCARVGCKTFWWQPGGITDSELYEEYIEEYPYLTRDYSDLLARHGVTHIVVSKRELEKIDWQYNFKDYSVLAENEIYIAYKV